MGIENREMPAEEPKETIEVNFGINKHLEFGELADWVPDTLMAITTTTSVERVDLGLQKNAAHKIHSLVDRATYKVVGGIMVGGYFAVDGAHRFINGWGNHNYYEAVAGGIEALAGMWTSENALRGSLIRRLNQLEKIQKEVKERAKTTFRLT